MERLALVEAAREALLKVFGPAEDVPAPPAPVETPAKVPEPPAVEDPVQAQILELLQDGPMSPGKLAHALGLNDYRVRPQVEALTAAGLVTVSGTTNWRRVALAAGDSAKEAP